MTSVSSGLVQLLLFGAGFDEQELRVLIESAGIDPSAVVQRTHDRIDASQFAVLWDAIESAADDPCFGLHLGELRNGAPTGHVLFNVVMNSATIGAALSRLCRYHDIMASTVQPRLEARGERVVLGLRAAVPAEHVHRQHVECSLALMVSVVRGLARGRFEWRVSVVHDAPTDTTEHERILGPVCFNSDANEVVLPSSALELPVIGADAGLLLLLEQHARRLEGEREPRTTWADRVSGELSAILCDGKPTLQAVAARLRVSPRTLQRRLREEATSFQRVVEEVRKDLGISLLRSQVSLAEVAFLLGFADQSAFSHSFRRWTGESPRRFRRRHQ